MNNKPDKIEKLEYPAEDADYISAVLEGVPYPSLIEHWESLGYDIKYKTKWYAPGPPKERLFRLRQKYHVGSCCRCHGFPSVKLTWKHDGASRIQYWCNTCYSKLNSDNQ
jgi:hypothetical protein